MSRETIEHLNTQTLIGYTEKRGRAWHYREESQGEESNHYSGPVPAADVTRRLFNWKGVEGEITATAVLTDDDDIPTGTLTFTDPERKAIMRSDTGEILGVFKSGYRIHQYEEWLVKNVEVLLDADLAIGSAGLLKGGGQAWVQIEMEDTRKVCDVEYRPHLTAVTSMDGSLATTYIDGNQIVVCDNTMTAALGSFAHRFKVYHSKNSLGKLDEAREALAIVTQMGDAFDEAVRKLVDETVSEDRWNRFVSAYVNPKQAEKETGHMQTKRDELTRLWKQDERVAPWRGSAYGVLTAVNTFAHHSQIVRGRSRAEANMQRVVEGQVDALDRSTLSLLATV